MFFWLGCSSPTMSLFNTATYYRHCVSTKVIILANYLLVAYGFVCLKLQWNSNVVSPLDTLHWHWTICLKVMSRPQCLTHRNKVYGTSRISDKIIAFSTILHQYQVTTTVLPICKVWYPARTSLNLPVEHYLIPCYTNGCNHRSWYGNVKLGPRNVVIRVCCRRELLLKQAPSNGKTKRAGDCVMPKLKLVSLLHA